MSHGTPDDVRTTGTAMDLLQLSDTRLGATVVTCNDEFFGAAANLLRHDPPMRRPGVFTDHGQWVDGWETRRRREPGYDWCVVRLGVPGRVRRIAVDTTHFVGNQPEAFWVGACGDPAPAEDASWFEVVGRTPLRPDARHEVDVSSPSRVTFLRLCIDPDGGVARFRVWGDAVPSPGDMGGEHGTGLVDLADSRVGAIVEDRSDAHFSTAAHVLLPGPPLSMGDGWETRRRRGPGHDWMVVRLAARGVPVDIEVDTTFFKGNAPATCWVEGKDGDAGPWRTLVAETPVRPHSPQWFTTGETAPVTHLRLSIAPDGGVARFRVRGRLDPEGAERLGMAWLDTLPDAVAERILLQVCGSPRWAREMAARRPFGTLAFLREAAHVVWRGLAPEDWREAFAAHPRIGEHNAGARARREQAGTADAGAEVLTELAEGNRTYEARFGHVFLIRATGRSADEILASLRQRLGNDADTELSIAAAQQEEITDLRLRQAVGM
ncbi:MAG: allantoicase [Actinomycetes bacterium]